MRINKSTLLFLAAAILGLLAAFVFGKNIAEPVESTVPADVSVAEEAEEPSAVLHENAGLILPVPSEYEELLQIELPDPEENGMLFEVSEKASIEAASANGGDATGKGSLFDIGRVNEEALRTMLQRDMSDAELFAQDSNGNYYIYYHPTEVTYVREDAEAMKRDQEQWTALTDWAWGSVRENILNANTDLTPCEAEQMLAAMGLSESQEAEDAMSELGITPDDMVGIWAEKTAGRGNIDIRKSTEEGRYDVQINWGNTAAEAYVWTMTAEAAGSNVLKYDDGKLVILTLNETGVEAEDLQYENGTGEFALLSTNELVWQDDIGHAGDDTVFISAD